MTVTLIHLRFYHNVEQIGFSNWCFHTLKKYEISAYTTVRKNIESIISCCIYFNFEMKGQPWPFLLMFWFVN